MAIALSCTSLTILMPQHQSIMVNYPLVISGYINVYGCSWLLVAPWLLLTNYCHCFLLATPWLLMTDCTMVVIGYSMTTTVY
nr:hypothetical protein MACL_00000611 [Theileria orientalis]